MFWWRVFRVAAAECREEDVCEEGEVAGEEEEESAEEEGGLGATSTLDLNMVEEDLSSSISLDHSSTGSVVCMK